MKAWNRPLLLLAIGCALLPAHLCPAEETPPPERVDARSQEILHRLADFYRGLDGFRAEATQTMRMEAEGMKNETTTVYTVAAGRPNRLAVVLQSGSMGATIVCDGAKLQVAVPMFKQYTVNEAPASFQGLFAAEGLGMMKGMIALLFLESLTADRPYDLLTREGVSARYVAREEIEGTACHHLLLAPEETVELEMWIAEGESPWLQKVAMTHREQPEEAGVAPEPPKNRTMVFTLLYSGWQANPAFTAETFRFAPPAGAQKVESFGGAPGGQGPHPLLGKPAPAFQLELLDGGTADLARHKGKEIVILDFWATWCGPCRKTLPMVIEIAGAYREKGVVLYAVDLAEPPEKVRPFLEKAGLKVAVPLDKDGKVGLAYGARSIPLTVIIGRDGTVQAVHTGLGPGLQEGLRKELEALLAGRTLAGGEASAPPAPDSPKPEGREGS